MIRRIKPSDAKKIEHILEKILNFSEGDVKVGMELVNIAANDYKQNDYHVFVYEEDEKVLGFHCTGKRPLTDAVYDLYWIAADPDVHSKGIGKELLTHAENFVKENNGRWILAETSSKESYKKTREFYYRNNYEIVARINDFYSVGSSLLVFGKIFNKQEQVEEHHGTVATNA
jgi:ribosomal protein S18 acetylase RimI-like enzyme